MSEETREAKEGINEHTSDEVAEERRRRLFSKLDSRHSQEIVNVKAKSPEYLDVLLSDTFNLLKQPGAIVEIDSINKLENALNLMPAGHKSQLLKNALAEMRTRIQQSEMHEDSTFSFCKEVISEESLQDDRKLEEKIMDKPVDIQSSVAPKNVQGIKSSTALEKCSIAIVSKHGKTIRIEEGAGKEALLCDLVSCNVFVAVPTNAVQIKSVRKSLLVFAPILTSVMVRGCQNMTLVIAAQQIRLFDCHCMKLFVAARGALIIEDSDSIEVAPYNVKGIQLNFENENWRSVKDFNWLSEDEQSPNWKILEENEWKVFEL